MTALAVAELDPNALLVALIGLIGIWLGVRSTKKKVREVHEEVRTNHGKRQGERVEEMGNLLEVMRGSQVGIEREIGILKTDGAVTRGMVEQLGMEFRRHDTNDKRGFSYLGVPGTILNGTEPLDLPLQDASGEDSEGEAGAHG